MNDQPQPNELNIHQRLAEVMKQVSYLQKEKKGGLNYAVMSHDKVTASVREHFVTFGILAYVTRITHIQNTNRTEAHLTMRFANIDKPSDFIDVESLGYGVDSQDKGPGKAISYAVKYAYLKTLGLETGEDPEFDQKTEHEDPILAAIEEFEADTAMAESEDDLRVASDRHKQGLLEAAQLQPARTQKAKVAWQRKMKQLKDKADKPADEKPAPRAKSK